MLKLIGFQIFGHDLFEDGTEFSLKTQSQLTESTISRTIEFNEQLHLNRVIGLVGINATGKSTLMKIFQGLNDLYLMSLSIDQTLISSTFRSSKDQIKIIGFIASTEHNIRYRVETEFSKQMKDDQTDIDNKPEWVITKESIYRKQGKTPNSHYFDSDPNRDQLIQKRADLTDTESQLLSSNDSIFRIISSKSRPFRVISTVNMTDSNVVKSFSDQTPTALLEYLDNSIEFLQYKLDSQGETVGYNLKFKGNESIIELSKLSDISKYLSSGTIKGITLFYEFLQSLRLGATLLVDEIELHVNKQIVRDFIGFFANKRINKNDSSLIYSTHYVELTDDLKRTDEEYILTRNGKTKLQRLNKLNARSELKNSELFVSNHFGGTSPSYTRYLKLKETIVEHNDLPDFFSPKDSVNKEEK